MRLGSVADTRDNNFDVLRLFAASIVLVSHSFFLAGRNDPFGDLTGITLGGLGVALFFAMSGFLILKSWSYRPVLGDFTRKRALRILPALWAAILLTTFVMGPIVTSLPLTSYLSDPGTWRYAALGSLLITFGGVLPGVFEGVPYPDAVNGSLWTLPVEASAYVMVAVFGIAGVFRRRGLLPVLFVVALAVAFLVQGHEVMQHLRLYAFFLAGMLLYDLRDRITLTWPIAAVAFVAWVLSFNTSALVLVSATALPYIVFVVAYRTPRSLRRLVAFGDVSYGLYIYAFPVQQLVALAIGDAVTWWQILVIAGPIAWLMGLASWRLVEQPALRRKPGRKGGSNSRALAPSELTELSEPPDPQPARERATISN